MVSLLRRATGTAGSWLKRESYVSCSLEVAQAMWSPDDAITNPDAGHAGLVIALLYFGLTLGQSFILLSFFKIYV